MTRKLALITLLSLVVTHTTTAAPGGSVTEMKSRIFSFPFSVYKGEDYRRAIASLPPSTRDTRITRGRLLRRVERVIRPVLELHHHTDEIELFLFQDHFPSAMVWLGCVLVISDALADRLHDDELAAIVAHEMGHAYFMIETIKARKHGDHQAMKIVELECDAVAMLTLKLLGRDPADYLRALLTITDITKLDGHAGIDLLHPSIRERTEFAQRFIKLLA